MRDHRWEEITWIGHHCPKCDHHAACRCLQALSHSRRTFFRTQISSVSNSWRRWGRISSGVSCTLQVVGTDFTGSWLIPCLGTWYGLSNLLRTFHEILAVLKNKLRLLGEADYSQVMPQESTWTIELSRRRRSNFSSDCQRTSTIFWPQWIARISARWCVVARSHTNTAQ